MLSRRSVYLGLFVGGAVAAQLGLLLVSVALAVCPETRAKSVVCPHDYDGECNGEDETECEADRAVSATYSQLLEDTENSPEQTKTQTDTVEANKVICFNYTECEYRAPSCLDLLVTRDYKVNPLKTIPCP